MEIVPRPEKTHGPTGIASHLNRYNASFAKVPQCDMNTFVLTLADHHDDLIMEKFDAETEVPKVEIEQPILECPRCKKDAEDSSDLMSHLLTHLTESQRSFCQTCGVVNKETDELLKKAQETQLENSFVRVKVENTDYTVGCPIKSPLFMFLTLRNMRIFMDEAPIVKIANPKIIKIELEREDRSYHIFFSWLTIDRARARIRRAMQEKKDKHLQRYYEQQCDRMTLNVDDVVFKKRRTQEETDCLSKALRLPIDFTQEQLMSAIQAMEEYRPCVTEKMKSYNAVEDDEGNQINKEQRKLISTLSNNFTFVPGGKRRCTRNRTYTVDV